MQHVRMVNSDEQVSLARCLSASLLSLAQSPAPARRQPVAEARHSRSLARATQPTGSAARCVATCERSLLSNLASAPSLLAPAAVVFRSCEQSSELGAPSCACWLSSYASPARRSSPLSCPQCVCSSCVPRFACVAEQEGEGARSKGAKERGKKSTELDPLPAQTTTHNAHACRSVRLALQSLGCSHGPTRSPLLRRRRRHCFLRCSSLASHSALQHSSSKHHGVRCSCRCRCCRCCLHVCACWPRHVVQPSAETGEVHGAHCVA